MLFVISALVLINSDFRKIFEMHNKRNYEVFLDSFYYYFKTIKYI